MTRVDGVVTDATLFQLGYDAGHIAALADMMAVALQSDPDISIAGEAAEGLCRLARRLSNELLTLADPSA